MLRLPVAHLLPRATRPSHGLLTATFLMLVLSVILLINMISKQGAVALGARELEHGELEPWVLGCWGTGALDHGVLEHRELEYEVLEHGELEHGVIGC